MTIDSQPEQLMFSDIQTAVYFNHINDAHAKACVFIGTKYGQEFAHQLEQYNQHGIMSIFRVPPNPIFLDYAVRVMMIVNEIEEEQWYEAKLLEILESINYLMMNEDIEEEDENEEEDISSHQRNITCHCCHGSH